jgi:hypothetical protein
MENTFSLSKTHVHILLFKCPESGDPVAAAALTDSASLEDVDARSFSVQCNCGWSGRLLGIERLRNWVEEWNNGADN